MEQSALDAREQALEDLFGETSFEELVKWRNKSSDWKELVEGAVAFWLRQMPSNIAGVPFKGTTEQLEFLKYVVSYTHWKV
jgi:hypothetical protein